MDSFSLTDVETDLALLGAAIDSGNAFNMNITVTALQKLTGFNDKITELIRVADKDAQERLFSIHKEYLKCTEEALELVRDLEKMIAPLQSYTSKLRRVAIRAMAYSSGSMQNIHDAIELSKGVLKGAGFDSEADWNESKKHQIQVRLESVLDSYRKLGENILAQKNKLKAHNRDRKIFLVMSSIGLIVGAAIVATAITALFWAGAVVAMAGALGVEVLWTLIATGGFSGVTLFGLSTSWTARLVKMEKDVQEAMGRITEIEKRAGLVENELVNTRFCLDQLLGKVNQVGWSAWEVEAAGPSIAEEVRAMGKELLDRCDELEGRMRTLKDHVELLGASVLRGRVEANEVLHGN